MGVVYVQWIGKERKGDKIFRHSVNFPFVQIENKLGPGPGSLHPAAGELC